MGLYPNGQSDREVIFPRWTERAKEEQSQQITGIAKDWQRSLVQFSDGKLRGCTHGVLPNFKASQVKFKYQSNMNLGS